MTGVERGYFAGAFHAWVLSPDVCALFCLAGQVPVIQFVDFKTDTLLKQLRGVPDVLHAPPSGITCMTSQGLYKLRPKAEKKASTES